MIKGWILMVYDAVYSKYYYTCEEVDIDVCFKFNNSIVFSTEEDVSS